MGVIVNSSIGFDGDEIYSWLGLGLNRTSTNFIYQLQSSGIIQEANLFIEFESMDHNVWIGDTSCFVDKMTNESRLLHMNVEDNWAFTIDNIKFNGDSMDSSAMNVNKIGYIDLAGSTIQVPNKVYDLLIKSNLLLYVTFNEVRNSKKCLDYDFCLIANTPCHKLYSQVGNLDFVFTNHTLTLTPEAFLMSQGEQC